MTPPTGIQLRSQEEHKKMSGRVPRRVRLPQIRTRAVIVLAQYMFRRKFQWVVITAQSFGICVVLD